MSDAVLGRTVRRRPREYFEVSDESYRLGAHIPSRKMLFVLQHDHRLANGIGIEVEYLGAVDAKLPRRQKSQESPTTAQEDRGESGGRAARYHIVYAVLSYAVFVLIGAGIIATAVKPTSLTELAVPIGITLWAILAYVLRKVDTRQ